MFILEFSDKNQILIETSNMIFFDRLSWNFLKILGGRESTKLCNKSGIRDIKASQENNTGNAS